MKHGDPVWNTPYLFKKMIKWTEFLNNISGVYGAFGKWISHILYFVKFKEIKLSNCLLFGANLMCNSEMVEGNEMSEGLKWQVWMSKMSEYQSVRNDVHIVYYSDVNGILYFFVLKRM